MKVCLAVALAAVLSPSAAAWARHDRTEVVRCVTDGDTFRLVSGERIRIAGIDAPETQRRHAHCAAELRRGNAAKAAARSLLDGRAVVIARVGRSYDRTVADVSVGGRDLGDLLVARGIARPWPRGRPKPDWCR